MTVLVRSLRCPSFFMESSDDGVHDRHPTFVAPMHDWLATLLESARGVLCLTVFEA